MEHKDFIKEEINKQSKFKSQIYKYEEMHE